MLMPPDEKDNPSNLINPTLIESALSVTFPGCPVRKGKGINRRKTYRIEFGEFSLNVVTAEEGVRINSAGAHTRADFRRQGDKGILYRAESAFEYHERDELLEFLRDARAYVMGLYVALNQVLFPPEEPDKPSIFDED